MSFSSPTGWDENSHITRVTAWEGMSPGGITAVRRPENGQCRPDYGFSVLFCFFSPLLVEWPDSCSPLLAENLDSSLAQRRDKM